MRAVCLASCLCAVMVFGVAPEAEAQADPLHFRFNSGQTIQPFFEGWVRNDDGSFEFHYGYLNRNYVEELYVPVGEANFMSEGADDQGQPTYFYPRTNNRAFSVTVPADFGDQRLIWQVTVNDETYRAEGWLQPEWEIFANPAASFYAEAAADNEAPTIGAVDVPSSIRAGAAVTLSVSVSDDGKPGPRNRRGRQEQPPAFQPVDGPTLPVNVPQIHASNRKQPVRHQVDGIEGLNVIWTQLRGPVGATLEAQENAGAGNGTAAVSASFASPGEYLFKVTASDGPTSVTREFSLTVR